MRLWLTVIALGLALTAAATAATPFKAVLTASTHTPKVNAKWLYQVRATDPRGKAVRATITTQIVDPFGAAHAVEFGDTHKLVTNYPFTGNFRDFIRFPPDSKGFKLTIRVTVKASGAKAVLTYWVMAR